MFSSKEPVTVPFHVGGEVEVTRMYGAVGSWKELTRLVAADLNLASALQLRPVEVSLDGWERGVLCVDTGSRNGSVVVHFYEDRAPTGNLMDMLEHPLKVTRAWWVPLAGPYAYDREPHPER